MIVLAPVRRDSGFVLVAISEKWLALEHSIHAAGHFSGIRVSQALDWSIVDFMSLSRPGVMAYGYLQSQRLFLIELS